MKEQDADGQGDSQPESLRAAFMFQVRPGRGPPASRPRRSEQRAGPKPAEASDPTSVAHALRGQKDGAPQQVSARFAKR